MDDSPQRGNLRPMRPFEAAPLRTPQGEDLAHPGRTPVDLQARIFRTEQTLNAVLRSLNGASIAAGCNDDGTITVTLTFPGLPGS